jgi:two-component system, NtrC family, sensor kinase
MWIASRLLHFPEKSNHPMVLNRDSALQQLWKAPTPAERIAIFYDIVAYSDELTPERSLYYHQQILEGARKQGDKVLEASVLAELGFITSRNGNTTEGLRMLYESLELAEATGNAQAIGIAYNNLGNCYPNNMQLSRFYMTKALEYSRKGNDFLFTCFNLNNLGKMFLQESKRDSALILFLESYKLAVEKNLDPVIPMGLLNLSGFDDKDNRLQYYHQAALTPFPIRNRGMSSTIAGWIAKYYIQEKRMDSAFYYASRVNNYASSANLTAQLSALNLMVNYYRALPNTDSTLSYLERFYALKDSLYGEKVVEKAQRMAFEDMQRQKQMAEEKAAFRNRMIVYFLSAAAILLTALALIFWRSKKREQQAKKLVQQQNEKLELAMVQLKTTQSQLVQSEKMASLGELTAGIAHEIQNPLNFVNNFSEVNTELIDEMKAELTAGKTTEAVLLADDIKQNNEKISFHGKRADSIVKGMLQHSRTSSGQKEMTDINNLADECLRLSFHGFRAKDKSFNAKTETHLEAGLPEIMVASQDIGRVLLNLITNSFYSVAQKRKLAGERYEPIIQVATKNLGNAIEIQVRDNGTGVPQKVLDKIFQPFFTTKPAGEGTGLGLSMSYEIITKGHGGQLLVDTKEGEYAEFRIILPFKH